MFLFDFRYKVQKYVYMLSLMFQFVCNLFRLLIEYGEILRCNRPLNPQLFHKVNASLNNEQSQRLLKFQYIFYLLIYRILAQNGSFAPVPSTIENTYSVADDTRFSDFLIARDMGSTLLTLIGVRNYVFVTCLKSSPREMSPFSRSN